MAIRLTNILMRLFFMNNFCVHYKKKENEKEMIKECKLGGWTNSKKNSSSSTISRRTMVFIIKRSWNVSSSSILSMKKLKRKMIG